MEEAWFIARQGMISGALATVHGPFASEEEATAVAGQLQPGSYTIYGPASVVSTFVVAAPVVTFS